jgi:3-oxoacyl-[acyl-carrier-protein] synthase-3
LTNAELEQRFDPKSIKSIAKMSGIRERRIAAPDQTAADLAFVAAKRLLDARALKPTDIDLLVFASQTSDYQVPATACVLHGRLELSERCAAFDINLGCSAYPYCLAVVNGMIVSGAARRALLLNADVVSKIVHPRDRGLVPLHGDGATATLLEPMNNDVGMQGFFLGTDGLGAQHIMIPASGMRRALSADKCKEFVDETGSVRSNAHLCMNGPAVFHFSVYKVPEVIREALVGFGLTVNDLDLVILHQANKTMLELIYRALDVPIEKRFYFMEMVGNTAGASTPMVLAEAVRQGRIKPGSRTLLASFGNGLSWGVALIRWGADGITPVAASVEIEG